jgi:hypothetical protein
MPVDTPSLFAQVIEDHLALKQRNARLGDTMPIERYKDEDQFDNHALFKSEEQARLEETMDGVEPDFSETSLEDAPSAVWPGEEQAPAAPAVDDATAENAAPLAEDSGFWSNGGAREFDWGD